jgi:hypothetical protein
MFRMIVYPILRNSIGERSHISIISVGQNPRPLFLQSGGQEISGPEDVWFACRPGIVRMPVQAMNENDIDEGIRRGVHFRKPILLYDLKSCRGHASRFNAQAIDVGISLLFRWAAARGET